MTSGVLRTGENDRACTARRNPPARSEMASDLRKRDRAVTTARKPPRAVVKPQVRARFATARKPHPYGGPTFRAVGPRGRPDGMEERRTKEPDHATHHPTTSTPPERRMAAPLPTAPVVAMSTDRTKAACERLFDLMSIEAVPYRREPAIVTPRPSWMSSYAAMFAHPAQMLDDGDAA